MDGMGWDGTRWREGTMDGVGEQEQEREQERPSQPIPIHTPYVSPTLTRFPTPATPPTPPPSLSLLV